MKINLLLLLAITAATAASSTCQKADYCPSTLCACNGACYSEDQYCCPNGQLTQKAFCSSSPVATTSSSSDSCTPVSIVPQSSCASSNPARDLQCCTSDGYGYANGSFCGSFHQCSGGVCFLTGKDGENCASASSSPAATSAPATSSSSSSSTCEKASYCASSLCACNGACYSEDQYCCPNGQLTQKAFCSSSSPVATASSSQQAVVKTTDGSTLTLVNKCAYTISLCSTYGGPLFDLAAGQNATNQPSGPYNECGSVQAEVTLNASNSQSCYDLSEVAYKQSKNPITIYSSTGPTLTCQTSPCSDASQPGGSYQVKCTSAPTSVVIQWC